MKKATLVLTSAVLITATAANTADVEYYYPSAYAELFKGFTPITPEEAQMWISAEGDPPGGSGSTGVILEPITFRTIRGTPAYYVLMGYHGSDPEIRNEAESIIEMLNNPGGFDPKLMSEKYEVINEFESDFSTFLIYVWPWHRYIAGASQNLGALWILTDFQIFSDIAKGEYGPDYIAKAYLYAAALGNDMPVIAFENSAGDKRYVLGNGDVATFSEVEGLEKAGLEKRSKAYRENKDYFDEGQKIWTEKRAEIEEKAVREGGFYQLFDYPDEESDGSNSIDNVPDFNQNLKHPNACWREINVNVFL